LGVPARRYYRHAELVEARRRAARRKAFYSVISNKRRNLLKRLSACIPNAGFPIQNLK